MTPQTSGSIRWRRTLVAAVAGVTLGGGVMTAPATALADPAAPSADASTASAMSADEALAEVAKDYDTGTGGGQISNLIHKIMRLRAAGFKPSVANRNALVSALDKRPNQAPLIEALQATLAFQVANQSRALSQPQQPTSVGITPGGTGVNPTINGPVLGSGGAVSVPIG